MQWEQHVIFQHQTSILTLLPLRGWVFHPTFLFFEFLKNGCYYQIQIWHAYKANKMTSDQYSNEDINGELDFEIRKKLFSSPDFY